MKTFSEFWPEYLHQHRHPLNRSLHVIGTLLYISILILVASSRQYRWLLLAPLGPYAFAWYGHFAVEKNTPATFTNPWFSLLADHRMTYLILTGQLATELKRLRISDHDH
ncbi:MAG: Mpo1-like protein [Holophagaceae bacterium]